MNRWCSNCIGVGISVGGWYDCSGEAGVYVAKVQVLFALTYVFGGVGGIVCRCVWGMLRVRSISSKGVYCSG
jgi:hypothetical protein